MRKGGGGGDSAKRVHTSNIMVNALLIEHMQSDCLFPPHTIVNVSMVSFRDLYVCAWKELCPIVCIHILSADLMCVCVCLCVCVCVCVFG